MKHVLTAIFVEEIAESRRFYEGVLGLKPQMDNGLHVAYAGFSIWQKNAAQGLIFGAERSFNGNGFELCFECENVAESYEKLKHLPSLVNPLAEQPWGQRVFRLKDPDGHLLEFAESIAALIERLRASGLSEAAIGEKTHMPIGLLKNF